MNLICDENHQYFLDNKPIPGFSEIIHDLKIVDLSFVDQYKLTEKAELGTNVHKTLEYYDTGTLDEFSLPTYLEPYLNAYKAFLGDLKPVVETVERKCWGFPMDNEKALFACTLDRVFKIKDCLWVIDVKTGNKYRSTRLQTAANLLAYNNIVEDKDKAIKRGALYLSEDGTYTLNEHKDDKDLMTWLGCVEAFWFKHPRYTGKINP
jgi:mRNA-degrading endonuclease HigB of HigAB toxin-antitoxin module